MNPEEFDFKVDWEDNNFNQFNEFDFDEESEYELEEFNFNECDD